MNVHHLTRRQAETLRGDLTDQVARHRLDLEHASNSLLNLYFELGQIDEHLWRLEES